MASQGPAEGATFCRECGKQIEADARFCRFCGRSQAERSTTTRTPLASPAGTPAASPATSRSGGGRPSAGAGDGLERSLRQLFPRHHLQDDFMHIGSIAAFFLALIGFVLGFFSPALGGSWLSTDFLLGSIALTLFLILRESTFSHIRARGGAEPGSTPPGGRYNAQRQTASELPPEAATTQSTPPGRTVPPPPTRSGIARQ